MSLHFLDCGPKEYFCLANHCVVTTENEGKLSNISRRLIQG